jgi:purine-nucleoside phosphorylase
MGIPSSAIYATELARVYGVRRIVRLGTCGGVGDVALGDLLIAQGASTDSRFNRLHFGNHDLAACADFALLRAVADTADRQSVAVRVAHVFSTDCFYDGDRDLVAHLRRHRILGIDMESAGLYGLAMREGIAALSLRREATRFDARFRLYDVLDWTRQPDGVPLPPLDGHLVSPKLEVSGATLESVEIVLDDEAMR